MSCVWFAPKFNWNELADIPWCYKAHYTYVRLEHSSKMSSKEQPSVTEEAAIVAKKLEAIWQKTSIPTVSRTRIVHQVKNYHDKHKNLLKPYKARQNNVKHNANIAKLQHKAECIFDICPCKCKEEALCSCPKELKVLKDEKAFLVNQQLSRKIIIGSIDRKKQLSCRKETKESNYTPSEKSTLKQKKSCKHIETSRFALTETDNDISSNEEEEDSDSSTDELPCTKLLPKLNATRMHKTGRLLLHYLNYAIDFLCVIELVLL